jgi:hypothetical protein
MNGAASRVGGSARVRRPGAPSRIAAPPTFTELVDVVTYRWTTERDTWLRPSELDAARSFLEAAGVATRELPDGSFMVDDGRALPLSGPRLFLLALRWLRAGRPKPNASEDR